LKLGNVGGKNTKVCAKSKGGEVLEGRPQTSFPTEKEDGGRKPGRKIGKQKKGKEPSRPKTSVGVM